MNTRKRCICRGISKPNQIIVYKYFFIIILMLIIGSINGEWGWYPFGLQGMKVNCILVQDSNLVYAGTEQGIYRYTDDKWTCVSQHNRVSKIILMSDAYADNDTLLAALDDGIYIGVEPIDTFVKVIKIAFPTELEYDGYASLYVGSGTGVYRATRRNGSSLDSAFSECIFITIQGVEKGRSPFGCEFPVCSGIMVSGNNNLFAGGYDRSPMPCEPIAKLQKTDKKGQNYVNLDMSSSEFNSFAITSCGGALLKGDTNGLIQARLINVTAIKSYIPKENLAQEHFLIATKEGMLYRYNGFPYEYENYDGIKIYDSISAPGNQAIHSLWVKSSWAGLYANTVIYAVTDSGIFWINDIILHDYQSDWSWINIGSLNHPTCLGDNFAGTEDGVYRLCLMPLEVVEKIEKSDMELKMSVLPNPFNPSTLISFTNLSKQARITIFDANGKIVEDRKNVTESGFIWDAKGMASGVYVAESNEWQQGAD